MSLSHFNQDRVMRYRNESATTLLQYANNRRIAGRFNDITIQAGSESIPANRLVLSCYSKFFERLFQTKPKRHSQYCLEISQFDGKAIKTIIEYIYTGRIFVDGDNVMNLLATADILQMEDVKRFCFDYFESELTVNNSVDIIQASSLYVNPSTLKKTFQLIGNNFDKVVETKKFKSLSKDNLIYLLAQLDQHNVEETSIYKAVIDWVRQDENRKSDFPSLFVGCNFNRLPIQFLKDVVTHEPLVRNNNDCLNAVVSCVLKKRQGNEKSNLDQDVQDHDVQDIDEINVNTRLMCVGGVNNNSVVEIYNINGNPKQKYPTLPNKLSCHCVLVLHRVVYCIGGVIDDDWRKVSNIAYRLDMKHEKLGWEQIESMNEKRIVYGAAIWDENLVVSGGWNGKVRTNSAELYDIHSNQWKNISYMQHSRMRHALVAAGGSLFAIGGVGQKKEKISLSVERLDNVEEKWKNVKGMNIPRIRFAAIYCDGYIYAIGGEDSMAVQTVEKYDLINDQWEMVKEMNVGRYQHAACVLDGKIFVVGGTNAKGAVNKIERYEAAMNKWMIVDETEDEMVDHALVAI